MSDVILERHISGKMFVLPIVGTVLFAVALFAIRVFTGKTISLLWILVALLPLVVMLIYAKLRLLSTAYRLYPDRLEIVSGILSRRIENLDLFRIRDLGLKQGIYGRIANFGNLYVHSTDSSTPDLHIQSIDAPEEFYRQMRQLVETSRAQRQTMIVEGTRSIPE